MRGGQDRRCGKRMREAGEGKRGRGRTVGTGWKTGRAESGGGTGGAKKDAKARDERGRSGTERERKEKGKGVKRGGSQGGEGILRG